MKREYDTPRKEFQKRYIGNKETTERRRQNRNKNRNANRIVYRKHTSEASRGDWQRMATEARRLTTQPQKSVFKVDTGIKIKIPQICLLEQEPALL